MKKLILARAKVNIKSLAAESKIIKHSISKNSNKVIQIDLYFHKLFKVRPEARLANLAIGFIKGMPKKAVEKSTKPIDIKRLHSKLCIFYSGFSAPKFEDVYNWAIGT